MSALTAGFAVDRRGPPLVGTFGYYVAPGEKVFRGGIVGVNAAFQLQRPQTAGTVAIVGVADRDMDNSLGTVPSTIAVEATKGVFALVVPSATGANLGQPVYAVDDGTLTLTQPGTLPPAGTLVGVESGKTYIRMTGA